MLALKAILAQSDRISVLVFDEIDANIGGRMGTIIGTKLRKLTAPAPGTAPGAAPGAAPGRSSGKSPGKSAAAIKSEIRNPKSKIFSPSPAATHQILCITHLPQIAAYADRHFRIAKEVAGQGQNKSTHTSVSVLTGDSRIDELAEMLAGKNATPTSRKQAQEMLKLATA